MEARLDAVGGGPHTEVVPAPDATVRSPAGDAEVVVGRLATPVGMLSVAVTPAGLARVGWVRGAHADTVPPVVHERVAPVVTLLRDYFAEEATSFPVPIDWRFTSGTQRTVLQTLHAAVPYGASITYGELAERSGTGVPARGIGAIMGTNPVPIVVPCHRVLAHDGLGGYSGGTGHDGLAVKRWLLALEGVLPRTFDWPALS